MEEFSSLDALILAADFVNNFETNLAPKPKEVNVNNEDKIFLETIAEFEKQAKSEKSTLNVQQVSSTLATGNDSIRNNYLDSSDEEQDRDHESNKYNDFGKTIKQLQYTSTNPSTVRETSKTTSTWKMQPKKNELCVNTKSAKKEEIDTAVNDPIFGMRISKPLISSAVLSERMQGRDAVSMARMNFYISRKSFDKDWVVAGAIVHKSAPRTSQKGSQFLIWQLSDLKDDIKTVSVFLFGNAFKQLWKTSEATIVGILNPSILEKKGNSKDEATLSVDNPEKVMIFGYSKDFGTCKSMKKNGEKCTAIVNVSKCEFCVYHIKQEYQKCSKRSDLQANFAGKGLTALRNKVLGKNEVFYGGKSYTAVNVAKKSTKQTVKDSNRLLALQKGAVPKLPDITNRGSKKQTAAKAAARLDLSQHQRARDLERLRKLGVNKELDIDLEASTSEFNKDLSVHVSLEQSKNSALDVIAKLKKKNLEVPPEIPQESKKENLLTQTSTSLNKTFPLLSSTQAKKSFVDLNSPIPRRVVNRAKINALKYVQQNGPLKKSDPMNIRGSGVGTKRALEQLNELDTSEKTPKKTKYDDNEFFSERFKKLMAATSSHTDLLDQKDDEEKEKYFNNLETKERLEEKMMTTYKIECKAVRCLQCKYTNFSASEKCKLEKHPLKVFNAFKRFFKCGDCKSRTVTLEIIPLHPCKNCGGGKWERTTMMKEKIATGNKLSIRGDEEKSMNCMLGEANLNLLVTDEGT